MLLLEERQLMRERFEKGDMIRISKASGKSYMTVLRWFNGYIHESPLIEEAALKCFEETLNRKKENLQKVRRLIRQFDSVNTEITGLEHY